MKKYFPFLLLLCFIIKGASAQTGGNPPDFDGGGSGGGGNSGSWGPPTASKKTEGNAPVIVAITCIHGATRTNMIQDWPTKGTKNWGCVVSPSQHVWVKVFTKPDNATAWNQIEWGDAGEPVTGQGNNVRSFDCALPDEIKIQATVHGKRSSPLHIWVMKATITVKVIGPRPADAIPFGTRYDGTEQLGAYTYAQGTSAVGKVVPIGKLEPEGVYQVARSGWAFKREALVHTYINGQPGGAYYTSWQPDDSDPALQRLVPNSFDEIYDRDAPNVGEFEENANSVEVYGNFRQFITWNGTVASDYANWHWMGKWLAEAIPQITDKEVNTGWLNPLP